MTFSIYSSLYCQTSSMEDYLAVATPFASRIIASSAHKMQRIVSTPVPAYELATQRQTDSNTGLRIGFMWTAGAFAELVGAPIAGALVKRVGHELRDVSYVGGQVFGGASIALGAAFLVEPAWSIFQDEKAKASRSA
ncbi:Riboflavin transporter MCH5 [Elsinoe australis]|uniref:Riboflavin transporter MCH5 n=1 Tax=Elsinoe australis TaxID=40998 RepID=A0A2P8ABU5_9PEZI|nr:Riboflavin transporter MCH5 [Elsinoe australis]